MDQEHATGGKANFMAEGCGSPGGVGVDQGQSASLDRDVYDIMGVAEPPDTRRDVCAVLSLCLGIHLVQDASGCLVPLRADVAGLVSKQEACELTVMLN